MTDVDEAGGRRELIEATLEKMAKEHVALFRRACNEITAAEPRFVALAVIKRMCPAIAELRAAMELFGEVDAIDWSSPDRSVLAAMQLREGNTVTFERIFG